MVAITSLASAAGAQTMDSNAATFNAGYGRSPGQENRPVENYGLRDADGNLTFVNGMIQSSGSSTSSSGGMASASASASGSFSGGVGGASSSAIGNNLTVITQGNYNTVIVNSTQTNTGNITAGATASGGASNAQ